MVVVDTIEGTVGETLWFHYDIANDVLYLRLAEFRDAEVVGEETPDGLFLMRTLADDKAVGLEVVNWWKRFGQGTLPDSMHELAEVIEPWTARLAA
jgi:hypothetical protein